MIYKKILVTLASCYLIVPLFYLIIKGNVSLLSLSDGYFMLSLPFLIIGLFIAILSSGFFDFFQKNMHDLINRRKKNTDTSYIPLSHVFTKKPVYWLVVAGTLFLTSLILSFIV